MKRSTRTSTSHRAYVDVDEQDNDFNNDDPMDVDEIPKVKTRRRAQTTKSPSKRKAKNAPEGELDSSLIRAIHSINATNVLNVPSLEELNVLLEHAPRLKDQDLNKVFPGWNAQLRAGSVIIVYGVGSKHRVLERFVDLHLADSPVVVVCGYKTNISMKHIFSGFMHLVGEVTAHSPQEIAMEINVKLQCVPCTVFLVIHSLDALCARENDVWQTLMTLCAHPAPIRLIASIDNPYATIKFPSHLLRSVLWYQVDTFDTYDNELPNVLGEDGRVPEDVLKSGVYRTLEALDKRSQKIFVLFAKKVLQLRKGQRVLLSEFKKECKREYLTTSDDAFATVLHQFKAHEMIKEKLNKDGYKILVTPLSENLLQEVVSHYESDKGDGEFIEET